MLFSATNLAKKLFYTTICGGHVETSVLCNFIGICETTAAAAGARTRDRRNSQNKLRRTEVST